MLPIYPLETCLAQQQTKHVSILLCLPLTQHHGSFLASSLPIWNKLSVWTFLTTSTHPLSLTDLPPYTGKAACHVPYGGVKEWL